MEALKAVAPKNLWILCDGPRPDKDDEAQKVAEVRKLLEQIPWPCSVKRLYRDSNLGCFKNISDGVSWFLNDCNAGIILEDDIIPDPSFFQFTSELLERYANNHKVFSISGHNHREDRMPITADYGFSHYFECWGWATWKRAWDQFDPSLSGWYNGESRRKIRKNILRTTRSRLWDWLFRQISKGRRDSWAYRFLLSIWQVEGLVIIPRQNLTTNVGFNPAATQTAHYAGLEISAGKQSFPLQHPSKIAADLSIDSWFEDRVHSKSLPVRLKWLARKLGLTQN